MGGGGGSRGSVRGNVFTAYSLVYKIVLIFINYFAIENLNTYNQLKTVPFWNHAHNINY